MKNIPEIRTSKTTKALIGGAVITFAVLSAYLLHRSKQRRKSKIGSINNSNQDLYMERYIFTIPTDVGNIEARVEAGGECYAVHLDGKYAGSMWQDEEQELKWQTRDEALKPFIEDLAAQLAEAFSRNGFPSILKGAYPEIMETNWKTTETLEVLIKDDTDMDVFSTFLKDEILNLVTFEEHLDLMVKKQHSDYFVLIGIN